MYSKYAFVYFKLHVRTIQSTIKQHSLYTSVYFTLLYNCILSTLYSCSNAISYVCQSKLLQSSKYTWYVFKVYFYILRTTRTNNSYHGPTTFICTLLYTAHYNPFALKVHFLVLQRQLIMSFRVRLWSNSIVVNPPHTVHHHTAILSSSERTTRTSNVPVLFRSLASRPFCHSEKNHCRPRRRRCRQLLRRLPWTSAEFFSVWTVSMRKSNVKACTIFGTISGAPSGARCSQS